MIRTTVLAAALLALRSGEGMTASGKRFPVASAFVTARIGWVAGGGVLAATVDGGRSWRRQIVGSAPIGQLDAVDRRHVWAAGPTRLLRTADGGRHWLPAGEPSSPVQAVDFLSARYGWGIAARPTALTYPWDPVPLRGGHLMLSTDGGMHWRLVRTPAAIQSVCFARPSHGWIARGGTIWETRDRGRHWRTALRAQLHGRFVWRATVHCDVHTAWASIAATRSLMNQMPQLIYRLAAGGWKPEMEQGFFAGSAYPNLAGAGAPGEDSAPFTLDRAHNAHFLGIDPVLAQKLVIMNVTASPSAAQRYPVPLLDAVEPLALSFVTPRVGWVVGSRDGAVFMLHTLNGGRTWTRSRL
jgi:photosystem II stability/assembly factor-like uncharacterized protein